MTTTHPTRLASCPFWCTVDHEQQQREIEQLGDHDQPWHSARLAEGIDTDTHGPLYTVDIERTSSSGGTQLYVDLSGVNITAAQAEVIGLALIRAAGILRSCPDALPTTKLTSYQGEHGFVVPPAAVLPLTDAERALSLEMLS